MAVSVDIDALADVARGLLGQPGRKVMAISGAPGSGKSTLVETLAERLAGQPVAILPMDGYHYDDRILHAMERRKWKGAPDTFDVGGLRSTLIRLRANDEPFVTVPVFDRDLEISRGSARIIGPEAELILCEGNYLLLDADPWRSLHPLYDVTVMIDVPEDELRRRLRKRWEGYNMSEADIDFKLDGNDIPNGRTVAKGSITPDYVLRP